MSSLLYFRKVLAGCKILLAGHSPQAAPLLQEPGIACTPRRQLLTGFSCQKLRDSAGPGLTPSSCDMHKPSSLHSRYVWSSNGPVTGQRRARKIEKMSHAVHVKV